MKCIVLITLFSCLIAAIHSAAVSSPWPSNMENALEKCSGEYKMPKEDAKKILSHLAPATSEDEKCLMSCFMKDLGYLVDHKVNWKSLVESHTAKITNQNLKEKIEKNFESCEAKFVYANKNDCQIAYDAYNCH